MSWDDWTGDHRRGAYDDYDHSDEEMYVDDQCCGNCRYFRYGSCGRPEHDDDFLTESDWCELWKGRGKRR